MTRVSLSDAGDYRLVDDDQDVRGRTVVDQNGQTLGTVDSMLLDTDSELITTLVLEDGTEVPVADVTLAGDVVRYDRSGQTAAPDRAGSAPEGAPVLGDGPRGTHAASGGPTGVTGALDDEAHFASTYGQSGQTFAQMQPAYDYGRTARSTYGDRDFASSEPAMRQDYESRYGTGGDSAWDNVKDAVRHGFDRARHAVS